MAGTPQQPMALRLAAVRVDPPLKAEVQESAGERAQNPRNNRIRLRGFIYRFVCGSIEANFLARLEANGFPFGNGDLLTCPGISSHPRFSILDAEYSKSPQFDSFSSFKSPFQGLENIFHRDFWFALSELYIPGNTIDDILFNHKNSPLKRRCNCIYWKISCQVPANIWEESE